jgi:two-component system copper resistance phosphate regulon response regulator CusR
VKVLVIEDYRPLRESVVQGLRENGYAVDETGDGDEGLWYASTGEYDVVVLDLRLPKMDGLEILTKLRKKMSQVHILIVTARDSVKDRVRGLDLGADDYLVKPFEFNELLARVRALIRRKYEIKTAEIVVGDLRLDTVKKQALLFEKRLDLTAKEYAILELLALRRGRVVSREVIQENIYDFASEIGSNIIDVYIGRLRKKLEKTGAGRILHTKRGFGYMLGEQD